MAAALCCYVQMIQSSSPRLFDSNGMRSRDDYLKASKITTLYRIARHLHCRAIRAKDFLTSSETISMSKRAVAPILIILATATSVTC